MSRNYPSLEDLAELKRQQQLEKSTHPTLQKSDSIHSVTTETTDKQSLRSAKTYTGMPLRTSRSDISSVDSEWLKYILNIFKTVDDADCVLYAIPR